MNATPAAQADSIDVPPTNVLTLAAAAVAHARYPWLDFRDQLAERVWQRLGADASRLSDIGLRAALGRTLLIDRLVERWARGHSGDRVVEVGAGLSTRHARLSALALPIVTVDDPAIARMRRRVFMSAGAFASICAQLDERAWVRKVARATSFIIVEDAFLAPQWCDPIAILVSLAAELPRGSLLAASYGPGARFVVGDTSARRAALAVQIARACGQAEVVKLPRFTWVLPPSPLDGTELPAVALLEVA